MRFFGATKELSESFVLPTQSVDQELPEITQTLVGQKSRAANLVSDVLVPLAQSLITGLLAAAVVAFALEVPEYSLTWGLAVAAIVWLVRLVRVDSMLGAAEKVFHVDINNDGYVGNRPTLPPVILNNRRGGATKDPRTRAVVVDTVPVHPFEKFVRGCAHVGTDIRKWSGLPRETYQTWRDQLIGGGWAMWNSVDINGKPNVTQGWSLTAEPDEILRACSIK